MYLWTKGLSEVKYLAYMFNDLYCVLKAYPIVELLSFFGVNFYMNDYKIV